MTVIEMTDRIKRIFGDTGQSQLLDSFILDWLNDGQMDIARKTDCLQGTQTTNIVSGTSAYALPTDFLKEQFVTWTGYNLIRTTFNQINDYYPDRAAYTSPSNPMMYYIRQGNLNLYPTPVTNATAGLVLYYVRGPATLVATPDIPLPYHEDLVRFGLIRAYEHDENWTQAREARIEYNERLLETIYDSNVTRADSYPAVRLTPGDYGDW